MSSNLHFKTLSMRNFLSFGNQESIIDLENQGTVTITGENIDQGGSNGAGKTTIINALTYALYNKAFDNITLQRLVNTTNMLKNTQMEVRLEFEKDGCQYEVFRSRGAMYTIEIKRDGEDITPGKGAIECDELLVDIIGMSYELFTKTIIFSGNSPAFLQLPLFQQRNQIEELFNITMLSEKAAVLKEKIRQTESDIKVAEAICLQQQAAIDLHAKHIREAQSRVDRWEQTRSADIAEIETTLATLSTVDFEAEKQLHEERSHLKEESAYLQTKLAPKRKDFQQLTKEVEKLMSEQEHLQDAKCPYCSQNYADAQTKLASVLMQVEEKGEKLLNLELEVQSLDGNLKARKERLHVVETAIQHPNLNDLIQARENVSAMSNKLIELKNATNPHEEALKHLSEEQIDSVNTSSVDDLRRRLDHQNFLLKLLTDKNSFLRRRIINKSIPFLNSRLNHFTNSLGLPHIVKFDADMSCTVSEYGRELDFGNLSAGEKKRVNTAMALAFRDVLHHLHAKTNLLIIDELDGALDQQGIDSIVRILKDKSRDEGLSVFVISHHPSIAGRLDQNLIVRKENGFSSIVVS